MRKHVVWLALTAACATAAPAAEQAPTASPAPVPAPEPEETQEPPAPALATTPEPPPEPGPKTYEPLALSEAQLARAKKIQPIVAKASTEHGIDANLLNGIIWIETKFNPNAKNRSGARGLMQLMPITSKAMAKRLGRAHRPMDPDFSVHAGAKLLSQLAKKFDGNEDLALFGYARGGGRVRAWQKTPGEPIPPGVQKFIDRVRRAQSTFADLGFPNVD